MPLYNVTVTLETQIVVVAEDEDYAYQIAQENAREAIDNDRTDPDVNVRGEVTNERHLYGGWDGTCVPYGGDGNTRISALLTPNAKGQEPCAAVCARSPAPEC